MCKAIEELKRDERREGREEGRKNGEMMMAKMIKSLMKNQKITFEEAVVVLEIPKRMQGKMKTMV